MKRLQTLDRRTCETLGSTSQPPKAEDANKFVATIAGDQEVDLEVLKNVKGWKRTHSHHVYDSLKTGAGQQPQENTAPKYVVVHGQ